MEPGVPDGAGLRLRDVPRTGGVGAGCGRRSGVGRVPLFDYESTHEQDTVMWIWVEIQQKGLEFFGLLREMQGMRIGMTPRRTIQLVVSLKGTP